MTGAAHLQQYPHPIKKERAEKKKEKEIEAGRHGRRRKAAQINVPVPPERI